jgi:hypothetical protein
MRFLLASDAFLHYALTCGRDGGILAWRNGSGSRLRRSYLSLVALASAAVLFFLGFWNLLGFNY